MQTRHASPEIRLADIQGRRPAAPTFLGDRPGGGLPALPLPRGKEVRADGFSQEHGEPTSSSKCRAGACTEFMRPCRAQRTAAEPDRNPEVGEDPGAEGNPKFIILESEGKGKKDVMVSPDIALCRGLPQRDGRSPGPKFMNIPSPTAPTAARASPSSRGCPTTGPGPP